MGVNICFQYFGSINTYSLLRRVRAPPGCATTVIYPLASFHRFSPSGIKRRSPSLKFLPVPIMLLQQACHSLTAQLSSLWCPSLLPALCLEPSPQWGSSLGTVSLETKGVGHWTCQGNAGEKPPYTTLGTAAWLSYWPDQITSPELPLCPCACLEAPKTLWYPNWMFNHFLQYRECNSFRKCLSKTKGLVSSVTLLQGTLKRQDQWEVFRSSGIFSCMELRDRGLFSILFAFWP